MGVCSPITTCARSVVHVSGHFERIGSTSCSIVSLGPSTCCFSLYHGHSTSNCVRLSVSKTMFPPSIIRFQSLSGGGCFSTDAPKRHNLKLLSIRGLTSPKCLFKRHISLAYDNANLRLSASKRGFFIKYKDNSSASKRGFFIKSKDNSSSISWSNTFASAGLSLGLVVGCSHSESAHAEAPKEKNKKEEDCDLPYVKFSQGKKVYTDYSIIGIPGDGRCLFRSMAHGACLRAGKPAPTEDLQRILADDLRAKVADEFIKRRQETEWFVEGDFDTYVAQIRKPHVWGGEPELFIASHVLKMPITVYMYDNTVGGLISIAEYGQEYGKENPIRVLYHGFGHYDALQIPARKGSKSKL